MLLSPKRKTFSQKFIACLNPTQNSVQFENKDQLHSLNILDFTDSEKYSYFNGRKLLF